MSFGVVAKVLRYSKETLARRLILIVLAETAHDDGVVFLGQEEIAQRTLLSRTHVAEKLREMEADGVLETRKAQRGRRRIAVYRLVSLPDLLEVRYDRLPFSLDQPFTVSEVPTPSEIRPETDRVGSTGLTVSDLPDIPAPSPLVVEPPLEPPKPIGGTPKLLLVDGRNVGFDALAEECRVDIRNRRRAAEVGHAIKEIRDYVFEEFGEAGEKFEALVGSEVVRRARFYRERMSGATLTPRALAKWWHDVASGSSVPRGPTAEDFPDIDELG